MELEFLDLRQAEEIGDKILPLKERIEKYLLLSKQVNNERAQQLTAVKVMRICLIASLGQGYKRSADDLDKYVLSKNSQRIVSTFFTKHDSKTLFSALLKLRYHDCGVDMNDTATLSKIVAKEMFNGLEYLLDDSNLRSFLFASTGRKTRSSTIPELNLLIGTYDDEMEATLNINGLSVSNSQIIIAGATGSGKTNLLAVLIQQFRYLSVDSPYPVNFLLFDYKGEFSDPANNSWLTKFEVNRECILDPMDTPLPFSPFKNLKGKIINEVNLYSTEMANALCSIDRASISANMNNRLSEAIVNAYNKTNGEPITFRLMLEEYQKKMNNPDNDDSVSSVLKQLVRSNLFAENDSVNLVNECFIIKMDRFPKDGPIAKAIVYFVISKLNNIYEQLEQQAKNDDYVQIRHFTIIDEAHYMLDFDNRPLRNLISVGRNKGLSIILATQNMDSYKSKHFDFYANAQYPLIMKQQTFNDSVIKGLFGVSGKDFQEVKAAISGLKRGEIIIKDTTMSELGFAGKNYKKIRVTHLI